jgi:hypothetical protein
MSSYGGLTKRPIDSWNDGPAFGHSGIRAFKAVEADVPANSHLNAGKHLQFSLYRCAL